MSGEKLSDSELYYPEDEQEEYDTSFHQFLSNEEQPSKLYEQQNTENSQKEIVNFMPYDKKLTDFVSFGQYGKISILGLAVLTSLSLGQYSKTSV